MGNVISGVRTGLGQSFFIPTPPLTEKNLPDQTGKVFIITGGYAGVGAALCSILYSHNATVYVASRDKSKYEKFANETKSAHPSSSGSLHFLQVDLSDLASIKPAAEEFLRRESKLHWLNNNAGVMVPPKDSKGKQGLDLQYQTNILGPFLLTKLLLPVLKSTAEAELQAEGRGKSRGSVRVSWAGSLAVDVGSPTGGVEFEDEAGEGGLKHGFNNPQLAYGTTKAANYLLASEFGRRYGNNDGVLHNAYNPGNLSTELQRHAEAQWGKVSMMILGTILYPSVFGAYTELYAGLSPNLTLEADQGGYVVPWGRSMTVRNDIEQEKAKGESGKAGKLFYWCDKVTRQYA